MTFHLTSLSFEHGRALPPRFTSEGPDVSPALAWEDARALPEDASNETLPRGAHEGTNDWREPGWRGPAPPTGRHRYFFKLYALDAPLDELGVGASKHELEHAMDGHVLGTATLVGTYEKHH